MSWEKGIESVTALIARDVGFSAPGMEDQAAELVGAFLAEQPEAQWCEEHRCSPKPLDEIQDLCPLSEWIREGTGWAAPCRMVPAHIVIQEEARPLPGTGSTTP